MKVLFGCFWSLALVIGCTLSYAVEYDVKVFEKYDCRLIFMLNYNELQ